MLPDYRPIIIDTLRQNIDYIEKVIDLLNTEDVMLLSRQIEINTMAVNIASQLSEIQSAIEDFDDLEMDDLDGDDEAQG